jgi:hypothetical protein
MVCEEPQFSSYSRKNEAKNYRGITVLPVIGKCLEFLLRNRIREIVDELQNRLQRGFTPKVAPLYCALILEALDKKIPIHVAFLDAKPAFDIKNTSLAHTF